MPSELIAKKYNLDPSYEYCEVEISAVRKSLILQTVKDMEVGKVSPESIQAKSVMEFIDYYENYLLGNGWECYEIVPKNINEVRRLRKKKMD
jgi:hypothetical protein